MASEHIVGPGDWIGAIAQAHGFRHWAELWEHPVNEKLRGVRGSPDLLMIGDVVNIPAPEERRRGTRVRTGRRVLFQVRGPDVLRLRLAGHGTYIAAFGPIDYVLQVGNAAAEGKLTRDPQTIEGPLPPTATTAVLTIAGGRRMEFAIGGLGPVDEADGAYARLVNLGFAPAPTLGAPGPDSRTSALAGFQRNHGLEVTGELDAPTRAAIVRAYGS
jgi:hypothetical protein